MTFTYGGECVFGCRHNVWGGEGTCTGGTGAVDQCTCGQGYISKDSFGSPSCVPKRALTYLYITAALCGAITMGFLLWMARKQRHVSSAGYSRRAILRLRLIFSASIYCGVTSIAFWVAAAAGNLRESGMLHVLYCASMPLAAMTVAPMLDVWVDTLPAQLLPADSFASKAVHTLANNQVFVWVGSASLVGLVSFGIVTSFVHDIILGVRVINAATAVAAACALLCFNFVGFHLTSVINKAKRQVTQSAFGLAFYGQAIKTLWKQVAALSCAAIVWISAGMALEPRLGGLGAQTPVLPLLVMVLDGFFGFSFAAYFAKAGPARGACASPGAARTNAGLRDIGAEPRSTGGGCVAVPLPHGGSKAKGRLSGDKPSVSTTIRKEVHHPFSWPGHGKKRLVPTANEVLHTSGQ